MSIKNLLEAYKIYLWNLTYILPYKYMYNKFKDQTVLLPNVKVQILLYYSHLLYFSLQTLMYIGKGKFDHFTMYFNKI